MAKKKQTNVKSKKKIPKTDQDDPAYKNRPVVEDDEDIEMDDEVEEVGLEREDQEDSEESF